MGLFCRGVFMVIGIRLGEGNVGHTPRGVRGKGGFWVFLGLVVIDLSIYFFCKFLCLFVDFYITAI